VPGDDGEHMYEESPLLDIPTDDTYLWRYMNLSSFLHLLKSKSLYFCRKHELNDPWEGVHSATFKAAIDSAMMDVALSEEEEHSKEIAADERFRQGCVHVICKMSQSKIRQAAINCWHEDDSESVAMWSLYAQSPDGVAISTTVGRLKQSLHETSHSVFIGRVLYSGYTRVDERLNVYGAGSLLLPLFHKRKSYRHEREVRAVIEHDLDEKDILEPSEKKLSGFMVPVDANALIERIVVAPTYPAWGISALQNVVSDSGISVPIETSDLLNTPDSITADVAPQGRVADISV
jgi:hypothetical protein